MGKAQRNKAKKTTKQEAPLDYGANTIMSGVVCNACKEVLPDHTCEQHLDKEFMRNFHKCKCSNRMIKRTETDPCPQYPFGRATIIAMISNIESVYELEYLSQDRDDGYSKMLWIFKTGN